MSNQYADDIRRRQRLEEQQLAALRGVVNDLVPPIDGSSFWAADFQQRLQILKHEKRIKSKRTRHSLKRRARLAGATIGAPVDRRAIILRDKSICHICGEKCEPADIHLDHVIPLSKGGAHSPENIKVAHSRCNLDKRDLVLSDIPRYNPAQRSA